MDVSVVRERGFYVASWTEAGKRKRKRLGKVSRRSGPGVMTLAEAQAEAARLAEALADPPEVDERDLSVGQWCARYWELRKVEVSPGYVQSRRIHTQRFVSLVGAGVPCAEVSARHADDYRVDLLRLGLSDHTVSTALRTCKAWWERARVRRIVKSNPFDGMSHRQPDLDHEVRTIDPEVLVSVCERAPDPALGRVALVCYYAGLRRGEAMRLRWDEIVWERSQLKILAHKTAKARRGFRYVRLEPELERLLLDWQDEAEDERVLPVDSNDLKGVGGWLNSGPLDLGDKPLQELRRIRERVWLDEGHNAEHVFTWMGHTAEVARRFYRGVTAGEYRGASPRVAELEARLAELESRLRDSV